MSSLRPQSKERVLRVMAAKAEYDVICAHQNAEATALQVEHLRVREAHFLKLQQSHWQVPVLAKQPFNVAAI